MQARVGFAPLPRSQSSQMGMAGTHLGAGDDREGSQGEALVDVPWGSRSWLLTVVRPVPCV